MLLSCFCPLFLLSSELSERHHCHVRRGRSLLPKRFAVSTCKSSPQIAPAVAGLDEGEEDGVKEPVIQERKPRFKWIKIGPNITEDQKQAISRLPKPMSNRCKALMRQIICFSPQRTSLSDLFASWVGIMKPRRADWLVVLKQLRCLDHPLHTEVLELALLDESFEPNVRDYTKLIDIYGEQNRLHDAENMFAAVKNNGLVLDQVILTSMIHIYSKSGNLPLAEEAFEEMRLLGQLMDKRSYGSMIMAYIRAGSPEQGESILKEMEAEEIYAGREVYKALLRAYSMAGDPKGAQRVFNSIQLAGMAPDAKVCALLINAYGSNGQSKEARAVFENMLKAGIEPTDKCVSLVLEAYARESFLDAALEFLMKLERSGVMLGEEGSRVLADWFRRIGAVEEVEVVLRDYSMEEGTGCKK